jgi:hypothetical protein
MTALVPKRGLSFYNSMANEPPNHDDVYISSALSELMRLEQDRGFWL